MDLVLTPYVPEIGITRMLTPCSLHVPALIKHYYSDFIVRELDPNGCPVQLKDMTVPPEPELDAYKDFLSEPEMKKMDLPTLIHRAPELTYLSTEQKDAIISIYSTTHVDSSATSAKKKDLPTIPLPNDKLARKAIHQMLTSLKRLDISTTTVIDHRDDDEQHTYLLKFQFQRPRMPRPPMLYLHFVLLKAGIDTMQAIAKIIGKIPPEYRCKANDFSCRGTKDKRGVTVQRMCIRGVWPSVLVKAVSQYPGLRLKVGDFTYSTEPLHLGAHKGNEFELVIRNIPHSSVQILQTRLECLKKAGFINYFGYQRFGSATIRTHDIGRTMLAGHYENALWMLIRGTIECKIKFLGIEDTLLDDLLRLVADQNAKGLEYQIENLISGCNKHLGVLPMLLGLVRGCADPLATILKFFSKAMLTMYIHAFQAYLFNMAASRCIDVFLKEIEEGKRCSEDNYLRPSDLVRLHNGSIKIEEKIHILTEEDIRERIYTSKDIVIPLLGTKTKAMIANAASNSSQSLLAHVHNVYTEVLNKNHMSFDNLFSSSQSQTVPKELASLFKILIPVGDIRPLIVVPDDIHARWFKHASLSDIINVTEIDPVTKVPPHSLVEVVPSQLEFMPKKDIEKSIISLVIRFPLPSSAYATELLRELLGTTVDPATQKSILSYYGLFEHTIDQFEDYEESEL